METEYTYCSTETGKVHGNICIIYIIWYTVLVLVLQFNIIYNSTGGLPRSTSLYYILYIYYIVYSILVYSMVLYYPYIIILRSKIDQAATVYYANNTVNCTILLYTTTCT